MTDRPPRNAASILIATLCLDGAGVLALTGFAIASPRPATVSLAVAAAAGWLLALAGVPSAVRSRRDDDIRIAQMRVATGVWLTVFGAVFVLVSFPSAAMPAVGLVAAGVAVTVVYLLLLPRLRVVAP